MTQHQRIHEYIDRFGSISPAEAFNDLGISKLSTRVWEMERAGIPIMRWTETGKNRYGETTRYTRYAIGVKENKAGSVIV